MADPQLLVRLDAIIALLALTLVVATFVLLALDLAIGVVAVVGLALAGVLGLRSYRRELRRAAGEDIGA